MRVAIQFIDGKDIIIEDAYSISALPDEQTLLNYYTDGAITINREQIKIIERFYGEDNKNE